MTNKSNRPFLWASYFIWNGFMSLLFWNSLLNITDYFESSIAPGFFNVLTFVFSFGQIIAFLTMQKFFSSLSKLTLMRLSIVSCNLMIICWIATCESTISVTAKKGLATIASFLLGYFTSSYQGTVFNIASSISGQEIVYTNFGTGVSGVLTNIIAYILTKILPFSDPKDQPAILSKRVYAYVAVILVLTAIYYVCEFMFLTHFPEVHKENSNPDQEAIIGDSKEDNSNAETSNLHIITKIFWILIGLFFMYVVTISFVVYFVINSCIRFDGQTIYTIPLYLFFFNLWDTIGKFLPPRFFLTTEVSIHFASALRLIIWVYMAVLMFGQNPSDTLKEPFIRVVFCIIIGFSNGWLTNCYMAKGAENFSKISEKGLAGYYSVLFLVLGVTAGSALGVLFSYIKN